MVWNSNRKQTLKVGKIMKDWDPLNLNRADIMVSHIHYGCWAWEKDGRVCQCLVYQDSNV